MKTLFVYLPCYNEAGNIRSLIEEWMAEQPALASAGYALAVIPINDASTDDTLTILRQQAARYACLRYISHKKNQNLGGVLATAIRDFLASSGPEDLLCFMDGDDTHKPKFVHAMLQKLDGPQQCVIASRYQPGAQIQGVQENRKLFSDGARLYYTLILHVPHVRDYTCGYRVYTRQALAKAAQRFGDDLIQNKSFACMMELLYKLHRTGCTFSEVPFTLYYDEKQGESKMNLRKTIHDSLLTALQLRFCRK